MAKGGKGGATASQKLTFGKKKKGVAKKYKGQGR